MEGECRPHIEWAVRFSATNPCDLSKVHGCNDTGAGGLFGWGLNAEDVACHVLKVWSSHVVRPCIPSKVSGVCCPVRYLVVTGPSISIL